MVALDNPTMIYRGTTPQIDLNIRGCDLSLSGWQATVVTISSHDTSIEINRNKLSVSGTSDGCVVEFHLTQAQTLAFAPLTPVDIQLRARASNGDAIATPIRHLVFRNVLKDGEI